MPVALQAALTAIAQAILLKGAVWLVQKSIWTQAQSDLFVPAAATWVVLAGWNWVQAHRTRQQINTALALPPGSTREDVKDAIDKKEAPPASVPANVAPYLEGEKPADYGEKYFGDKPPGDAPPEDQPSGGQ